jgi:hypothetical protein
MNPKSLILAALLAVSSLAGAATVPLTPEGCSDNRMCFNADGAGTTVYANPSLVELILADGTVYLGVAPVGLSIANFPVYRQPGNDAVIYVTASWVTWTTKGSGSGRGGFQVHTHWALTGGELLVLP